ncbi:MAG: GH116 family glycosyl-hydrolase [Planctomycetota bacterium]|jgi:uncharacterized protein (DUF608 family)
MTSRTCISYPGEVNKHYGMALGGLGTGSIGIDHAGRFQEVRVQNNWSSRLPDTPAGSFFSIYTKTSQKKCGRVLQLEQEGDLTCIEGLDYHGDFPVLELDYHDRALPCEVKLQAFTPMIPHDADSSSLPLTFFTFKLHNPGKEKVKASVAFSWQNDISIWMHKKFHKYPSLGKYNTLTAGTVPGVLMSTHEEVLQGSEYLLASLPSDGVEYSSVADWWNIKPLQCAGPDFDNGNGEDFKFAVDNAGSLELWRSFLDKGELPSERDFDDQLGNYSYHSPTGAVAGKVELSPGESREIRFALCWYFPYHLDGSGNYLGHWYSKRFPEGCRQIALEIFPKYENLLLRSTEWKSMIGNASLPESCLQFLNSVLYLLPRITWRLEDGRFTYYESIDCPRMFCLILEQYAAPVMAAFFPELHAKALEMFTSFQLETGEIPTTLGFGESVHTPEFRVFSPNDVAAFPLTVYTNMMVNGDREFAEKIYPKVKAAMHWGQTLDVDGDGIPDCHGIDQGWDTWPMQGAVCYIADLWLAALKAGEKMAEIFNDAEFADWCRELFQKASDTVENKLWNGKYYNLFFNQADNTSSDTSFMDQFAGQTWGGLLGLGNLHPQDRIECAVDNIFNNNVDLCGEYPLTGAKPGGSPDSSSDKNRQSRAFVPCTIGSFSANAMRNGYYDRAVGLFEKTARTIIAKEKEPWLAQLLFDSADGKWFYGIHYVDLLMIWDVLHTVTGASVNSLEGTMVLQPPKIPARGPVFSKLFFGEVEYTAEGITLYNRSDNNTELNEINFTDPNGTQQKFNNITILPGKSCNMKFI